MSKRKREKKSEVAHATTFDSVQIQVQAPSTALLLLQCKESAILSAATEALSTFAEKPGSNAEELFDVNVIDNVVALVEHQDRLIQRFIKLEIKQVLTFYL